MKNIKSKKDLTEEQVFLNRQAFRKIIKKIQQKKDLENYKEIVKEVFETKYLIKPFVLITKSDDVRRAYSKMVNSISPKVEL